MCREKAQREGVEIDPDHIYVDRGISGASVVRAGFQAMLAAIEAGNFPEIFVRQGRQAVVPKRARGGQAGRMDLGAGY